MVPVHDQRHLLSPCNDVFSPGFVDGPSNEIQLSRAAAFHHAQTLRLLQARLNDFAQGQRDIVLGDSTLMVIIFLSLAAELMGNFQAAENHVSGLLKIVNLRGAWHRWARIIMSKSRSAGLI